MRNNKKDIIIHSLIGNQNYGVDEKLRLNEVIKKAHEAHEKISGKYYDVPGYTGTKIFVKEGDNPEERIQMFINNRIEYNTSR